MDDRHHAHLAEFSPQFSCWAAFMVGIVGSGHSIGLCGGLQQLAALFVIALGVSTLWQGLRFYLVMDKLVA